MRDDELAVFRCKAVRLGLDINLEISSSAPAEIDEAVIIAEKIGATSLRFIPVMRGIFPPCWRALGTIWHISGSSTVIAH